MGYETRCAVRVTSPDGTVRTAADAAVLIETDDLVVRGVARVKVPRLSITSLRVRAGVLTIAAPAATIALTLGDAADAWKRRLAEAPKRLIDKLDIKPGARVWLNAVEDDSLIAQLAERTSNIVRGPRATRCDAAFVGVEQASELERIARAANAIVESGSIWVIHRKGKTGVPDTAIFAAATKAGLVYTKVARVSDTHTAEKLVWPRAARGHR